jgi:hypothetical protein
VPTSLYPTSAKTELSDTAVAPASEITPE